MQILGHRGCRRIAQDNSLKALKLAYQFKADGVEIDLRLSANNELILAHDRVKQSADGDYLSFADAFPILMRFKGEIQLEIKPDKTATLERILLGLKRYTLPTHWRITSFDFNCLKLAKKILPNQPRGLLVAGFEVDPISRAKQLDCSAIAIVDHNINASIVTRAKRNRLAVTAWTVNSKPRAKQLKLWGVDVIITDSPHKLGHRQL